MRLLPFFLPFLFLLGACSMREPQEKQPLPERKMLPLPHTLGEWTPIPAPNGHPDVSCFVWNDPESFSYNGPVCIPNTATK